MSPGRRLLAHFHSTSFIAYALLHVILDAASCITSCISTQLCTVYYYDKSQVTFRHSGVSRLPQGYVISAIGWFCRTYLHKAFLVVILQPQNFSIIPTEAAQGYIPTSNA